MLFLKPCDSAFEKRDKGKQRMLKAQVVNLA